MNCGAFTTVSPSDPPATPAPCWPRKKNRPERAVRLSSQVPTSVRNPGRSDPSRESPPNTATVPGWPIRPAAPGPSAGEAVVTSGGTDTLRVAHSRNSTEAHRVGAGAQAYGVLQAGGQQFAGV